LPDLINFSYAEAAGSNMTMISPVLKAKV
jgi:hypothetical protein